VGARKKKRGPAQHSGKTHRRMNLKKETYLITAIGGEEDPHSEFIGKKEKGDRKSLFEFTRKRKTKGAKSPRPITQARRKTRRKCGLLKKGSANPTIVRRGKKLEKREKDVKKRQSEHIIGKHHERKYPAGPYGKGGSVGPEGKGKTRERKRKPSKKKAIPADPRKGMPSGEKENMMPTTSSGKGFSKGGMQKSRVLTAINNRGEGTARRKFEEGRRGQKGE